MKRRRVYGHIRMADETMVPITDPRVAAYIQALLAEVATLREQAKKRESRIILPN